MRTGSVLFLCGVLLLIRLPQLPPLTSLGLLPACLLLCGRHRRLRWLAWLGCGFFWALLRAGLILNPHLAPELEARPVTVTGRVAGLPETGAERTRFEFRTEQLLDPDGNPRPVPGPLLLNWYRAAPDLVPGESWRLQVQLKRPRGLANPGGFDYEAWLLERRIRATGYVLNRGAKLRLRAASGYRLQRLRGWLRARLQQQFPGRASGALVRALVIGDRSAMSERQWRVLSATGTSHLLAISGLHIGFIAGLVFLLVRRAWPLAGALALRVPAPRAAAVCAMTAAAGYAALAGFTIPTQRALIMTGAVLLRVCLHRRVSGSRLLAGALLLVLLRDPFAVLAPGFWLSFGAVALILYGVSHRVNCSGLWWRWGRAQWLVSAGMIPVLAWWFGRIPLLGVLANLIAVPWVSLVSLPLLLCGSLLLALDHGPAALLLQAGAWSLDLLWPYLELLGRLPGAVLPLGPAGVPSLLAGVAGSLILLQPRGLTARWLGLIWLLPLLFAHGWRPQPGDCRLLLLDVGQGLAAVVQTRNHVLLYDTGPGYRTGFNAGSDVILPVLRRAGIARLDMLVLSHGDRDHSGGLSGLLGAVPIREIRTSIPGPIRHPGVTHCQRGQAWNWDGVGFEMLHPEPGVPYRGNDSSCVLRVGAGSRSILLTGDIGRGVEHYLVARQRGALHAAILIAPHHGSRHSSSAAFIRAVDPALVLFASGYLNRFGFPNKDIIASYRRHGVAMLNTASSGAIEIRLSPEDLRIVRHRDRMRRFWHTE